MCHCKRGYLLHLARDKYTVFLAVRTSNGASWTSSITYMSGIERSIRESYRPIGFGVTAGRGSPIAA